tara:strand:+ start:223 stop:843 length:621 start_codon:yes stop_codon:yes gene_type:complete
MKYFKSLFTGVLMLCLSIINGQSTTIEDVEFKNVQNINSSKTFLNGGGLREKYGFMNLYVGALYIHSKTNDANKVIMANEDMGIRIVIVSSLVTRERFIDALEEGFENSSAGKSEPGDIEKFKKFLSDEFVEGDEIILNYHYAKSENGSLLTNSKGDLLLDETVYLYKNGKERGTFKGLAFKQALFAVWLGDKPADDSLKEDMLGK